MYMVVVVEGTPYKALIIPQSKLGARKFKATLDVGSHRITVFADSLATLRRRVRLSVVHARHQNEHDRFIATSWTRRLARWFYRTVMRWQKPWYRQVWGLKGDITYGWGPGSSDWHEHISRMPSLLTFYNWYTNNGRYPA